MEAALTLRKNSPPELSEHGFIHHLSVLEVEIGHGAMTTMRKAMQEVANQTGVSYAEVMHGLSGHMYWIEATGSLLCVIPLPEDSLYLEIPANNWRIREVSQATH